MYVCICMPRVKRVRPHASKYTDHKTNSSIVDTCTRAPISTEVLVTAAIEGARNVFTGCISMAVMGTIAAFIDI